MLIYRGKEMVSSLHCKQGRACWLRDWSASRRHPLVSSLYEVSLVSPVDWANTKSAVLTTRKIKFIYIWSKNKREGGTWDGSIEGFLRRAWQSMGRLRASIRFLFSSTLLRRHSSYDGFAFTIFSGTKHEPVFLFANPLAFYFVILFWE